MSANFNYGEVLQKSFLFYEAQRSGALPSDSRITWRGDSALNDGALEGRDLSGGYYDAGDHVKFVFPMAGAMTLLGWGLQAYQDGYIRSNQYDEALDALKWGTDWLLKAHETDAQGTTAFWMQVGNGDEDHSTWIPPEDLENPSQPARPAFKLDRQTPGSDVAAEAAAALASASIVFRPHDEAYADQLLDNAIQLYDFADDADLDASNGKQRGKYSDVLHQLAPSISSNVDPTTGELEFYGYYHSWNGYSDELLWSSIWLHKAQTAKNSNVDTQYLALAEEQYQQTYFNAPWTQNWNDKSQGAGILLAQITQNQAYRDDVEDWLNRWLPPGSANRLDKAVAYTPGGLAWLDEWGSLRYSANTAFLAGIYADTVADPDGEYSQFAQTQIDYMLGDNPNNFSYVVGFGENSPLRPHHQGASGVEGFGDGFHGDNPNPNVIYGALVGGPKSADDNDYQDVRTDFIANEVALDYNAAFTGAVARLYALEGGEPLSDEQLAAVPEVTYAPHLQLTLDGDKQDVAVTPYGGLAQNKNGSVLNVFLDESAQLIGNGWRKVALSYNITANTRLQLEFKSEIEGEIQGIGFDNDDIVNASDRANFFQLSGSQKWGKSTLSPYVLEQVGDFTRYEIPIGQFLTGQFDYLTLANDHDVRNADATAQFRNISLWESAPTGPGLLQISVDGAVASSEVESYGGDAQDRNGVSILSSDNQGVTLTGNGWKKLELLTTIGVNSRLQFEVSSNGEGEVQGIGFDDDNVVGRNDKYQFFQTSGSQRWGLQNLEAYVVGQSNNFTQYDIPIGDFISGQFQYLTFANDHDVANPSGVVQFRNIQLTNV